jgi:ABC-2 type transport system permease protein
MKIVAIIRKAIIMQIRDLWAFALTLLAAPFFILVYYAITSGGSTTYTILYQTDQQCPAERRRELLTEFGKVTYNNGPVALKLQEVTDTSVVKEILSDRKADLFMYIPAGFFDSLDHGRPPHFRISGEASNPKYSVGLIFTIMGIENLVKKYSHSMAPYSFEEVFLGNSVARSEFDIYAPGIFVFSIIMLILSCSLSIIRDIEDKTMLRLKLSRMTALDYLAGNTVVQWFTGVLSFGLTLWLAVLLGFQSAGSLWMALLVCSLTILSIIAISLILVAFCRNATMVLVVGNFPLFILMFFSGSMMPMPRSEILPGFALNDLLPPTHAVVAMNKIFTYGAGFHDLWIDLVKLGGLTAVFFAIGVVLFKKRHMTGTGNK